MPAVKTQSNAPTFESVWALIQENAQKSALEWEKSRKEIQELRESQKETARIVEETSKQMKETDRQMKETDRQMKETDRRLGKLGNRFGEIVEYIIAPNLLEKFWDLGYIFNQANPNARFYDGNRKVIFEVDVFLENGDKAMLVEVKSNLTTEDVKDHIERMGKMRVYADLHDDKRIFLGACAGVVMTANVKEYALKQGFYVIEPSGETFNIISPTGKPKEW